MYRTRRPRSRKATGTRAYCRRASRRPSLSRSPGATITSARRTLGCTGRLSSNKSQEGRSKGDVLAGARHSRELGLGFWRRGDESFEPGGSNGRCPSRGGFWLWPRYHDKQRATAPLRRTLVRRSGRLTDLSLEGRGHVSASRGLNPNRSDRPETRSACVTFDP
jgi:hypothetical protein